MSMGDENSDGTLMNEQTIRDFAMREALGLLEDLESERFEVAFEQMSPDEQAAVLDLQAAVVREVAGAGDETPDRALRYHVLARLTEEMASDPAASGPLATIGRGGNHSGRQAPAAVNGSSVSELQFDRVSRSAAVWRAAAFALGSAVITLLFFQWRTEGTLNLVVERLGDQVVTDEIIQMAGPELDLSLYLENPTAIVTAFTAGAEGRGIGSMFAESIRRDEDGNILEGPRRGMLVCFQLPSEVEGVRVVAIRPTGEEVELGEFDVQNRQQLAALKLDLTDLPETGLAYEVRDRYTGDVLLRSV